VKQTDDPLLSLPPEVVAEIDQIVDKNSRSLNSKWGWKLSNTREALHVRYLSIMALMSLGYLIVIGAIS